MPRAPASLRRGALPALAAALVAASWLARLAPAPAGRLPAPVGHAEAHVDTVLHVWQYAWLARALESGEGFATRLLTFPEPVDLASLWEGHLDLVAALPFATWAGPVATANAVLLLALVGFALGAWVLAREVSGSDWAAAGAAALLVSAPPVLHELSEGRADVLAVGLLGPVLVGLGRWYARGRPLDLALAGAAVALAILGYLALGPILPLLLVPVGLGWLAIAAREPEPWARGRVLARRTAGPLLALGLLAVPALLWARSHVGTAWDAVLVGSTGGPEYQGWLATSRVGGIPIERLLAIHSPDHVRGTGIVLALAALASLLGPDRRRTLPWWLGALALHALALGPVPLWKTGTTEFLSPYAWLPRILPFFLRFHWPHRLLLLGDLCLAVLAARGLVALAARLPGWASRPPVAAPTTAAVAALLGILQVAPEWPLPAVPVRPPPTPYAALAADRPTAVLEAAAGHDPSDSLRKWLHSPFLGQMAHGAPICCLEVPPALAPEGLLRLRTRLPALVYLLHGHGRAVPAREGLEALSAVGFSHVVLQGHPEGTLPPSPPLPEGASPPMPVASYEEMAAWLGAGCGPPVAREAVGTGFIEVYRLPPGPPLAPPRAGP